MYVYMYIYVYIIIYLGLKWKFGKLNIHAKPRRVKVKSALRMVHSSALSCCSLSFSLYKQAAMHTHKNMKWANGRLLRPLCDTTRAYPQATSLPFRDAIDGFIFVSLSTSLPWYLLASTVLLLLLVVHWCSTASTNWSSKAFYQKKKKMKLQSRLLIIKRKISPFFFLFFPK